MVVVKLLVWDSEIHDIPVYEMEDLLDDCRLSIWEMGINADIVEYFYPDNISFVEAYCHYDRLVLSEASELFRTTVQEEKSMDKMKIATSLCRMIEDITGENLLIVRVDMQYNEVMREFTTYIYIAEVETNKPKYTYRLYEDGRIYRID